MKIGIFGGTFNPPHIGHTQAAADAIAQLGLDLLIVVPAGAPPHKELPAGSPSADVRLQMTRDAFAAVHKAVISDFEVNLPGVRYTVDTIALIRNSHPHDDLYLLVGTDMYLSLETWKNSAELLNNATPAVFSRSDGDMEKINSYSRVLKERYGVDTVTVKNNVIDISSSELRGILPLREGERYIIDAIYSYIIKHRLYGAKPDWSWLRLKAYEMLDPKRLPHVAGCESEAILMAQKWGVDEDDAREAAILHDITKKLSTDEHVSILDRAGYSGLRPGRGEEKLYHSITGSIIAREMFGISGAVSEAIRWHTTGKVSMSAPEKVMYLTDYIEPSRDDKEIENLSDLRKLAYEDLDRAMKLGLEMSIQDMASRGIDPNRATYDALAYLGEIQ